jgi:hypothetical protein
MADDVKKVSKNLDFQGWYNQGGSFKEQLENIALEHRGGRSGNAEHEPVPKSKPVVDMEEIPTTPELEKQPELSGYIEKVEKEAELTKPVVDDYTQQVLINPPGSGLQTVKLPMTEDEIKSGLHRKVWESVRWLATWCVRQAKMLHGRIVYRDDKPVDDVSYK